MEQQNVTLTLPAHLLQEARHLAVDRGVSLSRFLAQLLEQEVNQTRRSGAAWERTRRRLEEGLGYEIGERIPWSRDDLHER